ncbi:MAG: amino acid ABC transporter permease [Candidatus Bipolaricaulia bacterium]
MSSDDRAEILAPPTVRLGPLRWLKENLFSTWYNGLFTVISLALVYFLLSSVLHWAITQARWAVIPANIRLFLVGPYPGEQVMHAWGDQVWRVWLSLCIMTFLVGWSGGLWKGLVRQIAAVVAGVNLLLVFLPVSSQTRGWLLISLAAAVVGYLLGHLGRGAKRWRRAAIAGWLLSFFIIILLLRGFTDFSLLPRVETTQWGGLLLTFLLAIFGIVASFPLGIFLALGRRSSLPVVRSFSILYIEIVRGVPLVTILFMASIMLPLLLPGNWRLDKVLRAVIGITLFSSAYMAENVRGGLQSVPQGQIDAAQALGLSGPLTTLLIVLPQALRAVIPAIVGQFISLFKDTSLVVIIGLLDLLNIGRSVLSNPDWLGLAREVFLFAAVIYWVFSYSMSYASRRIEQALGVGER